jgi:hypothetical protein
VGLCAGLDPEARGKIFASAGDRTLKVQSVVWHCIVWATQAHIVCSNKSFIRKQQWNICNHQIKKLLLVHLTWFVLCSNITLLWFKEDTYCNFWTSHVTFAGFLS